MKMSMHMKLMLMGLVILTAVFKIKAAQQQPPLQCWHCSSDTIGAEDFCGDLFNEDNIPVDMLKERNLSVLRNCNSTISSEHERAVCRKTVEDVNGKTVVKRFCYYTNKSDTADHCLVENTEKSVNRIYCGDCWTDKCNGAFMIGGSYLMASALCATIILIGLLMTKTINV